MLECINDPLKERLRGSCLDNVVHIKEQVDSIGAAVIYEKGGVSLALVNSREIK